MREEGFILVVVLEVGKAGWNWQGREGTAWISRWGYHGGKGPMGLTQGE